MSPPLPVVAIAGASGFVGQALAQVLAGRFRLVGLSRADRAAAPPFAELRRADLFSLADAEAALRGVRYAVYLVHSMMPSARLTQGSFVDLDLICADNFARAAARAGVEHIVYLGGLVPSDGAALSRHLASRVEVEAALAAHGVPLTVLRAGLILGSAGSSAQLVTRLVQRLPVMLCPRWTQTRTQPVAVSDVAEALAAVLGAPEHHGQVYDLGGPEIVSYLELMRRVAALSGRRRLFLPVPLLSPGLSRLWVSLVTGAPRSLVAPLIASLRHEMVAHDVRLTEQLARPPTPLDAALREALASTSRAEAPRAFRGARSLAREAKARSVQRMRLPEGRDAAWAAEAYLAWLPRALRGLIRVHRDPASPGVARFILAPLGLELLVLTHAPQRSSPDRQLFYVTGGALARGTGRARLELRQVLDGRTLLTAVHDFEPRLPWWIYRFSQALFHEWVMAAFRRHLGAAPGEPHAAPRS